MSDGPEIPPFGEILRRVRAALAALRKAHGTLIEQDVNERSITHHFANCLAAVFPAWDVDVEYNRNLGNIKLLPKPRGTKTDDTEARTIYPDIIVHRRDTEQNLLVVEVKKTSHGPAELDKEKLEAMTNPANGQPQYRYGLHVVLLPDAGDGLTWYENGACGGECVSLH